MMGGASVVTISQTRWMEPAKTQGDGSRSPILRHNLSHEHSDQQGLQIMVLVRDIQPWQHARRSRKEALPISLQFLLPSAKRIAMQRNGMQLNWNIYRKGAPKTTASSSWPIRTGENEIENSARIHFDEINGSELLLV